MGLLYSSRRALLDYAAEEAADIDFLLRLWPPAGTANQGYANAQVLDTVVEGAYDGNSTIIELDGTQSVVANRCAFTAPATPAWTDLGDLSQAITRTLGYTLMSTINLANTANNGLVLGFNDAVGNITFMTFGDRAIWFLGGNNIRFLDGAAGALTVGTYAIATDYQFALVLGGYDAAGVPWRTGEVAANYTFGASLYIIGGIYAAWTLLWKTAADNTSPLYAGKTDFNLAGNVYNFRVPDVSLEAVLQPTALALFDAANGTLLPAITPEVGGAYTVRSGTFDIQTNRANISVSTGARDVATEDSGIADGMFDTTIHKTVAVDSGEFGRCLRWSDADNYWMAQGDLANNQVELVERNAGVENVRASAGIALTHSVDYDIRAIADAQDIAIFLNGGNRAAFAAAALNENATIHGLVGNEVGQTFNNSVDYSRTSAVYTAEFGSIP